MRQFENELLTLFLSGLSTVWNAKRQAPQPFEIRCFLEQYLNFFLEIDTEILVSDRISGNIYSGAAVRAEREAKEMKREL